MVKKAKAEPTGEPISIIWVRKAQGGPSNHSFLIPEWNHFILFCLESANTEQKGPEELMDPVIVWSN